MASTLWSCIPLLALAALSAGSSGCTLKATLDTTSDTLTNFFSSTTGRSWLTEDGLVREDAKTQVFVAANWANLQQDLAKDDGEYLVSFERLLAIPDQHRAAFRHLAMDRIDLLDKAGPGLATFADTMTATSREWRAAPPPSR